MSQKTARPPFKTLTDLMRYYTRDLTTGLGQRVHKLGIHPDAITALGLAVVAIAAYMIAQGYFWGGAIILLLGSPLDALDGAVARAMQRTGKFGAVFDSTLDRYADGFIFMGLAYYFSDWGNNTGVILSLLALLGSELVPYVRARAEGIGLDCKIGLLTRMERMGIILLMLLSGSERIIIIGLWILVIGTHFTTLQRIWYVYRTLKEKESQSYDSAS